MNSTNNAVAAMTADIIQEAYGRWAIRHLKRKSYKDSKPPALLFYATLTKFSREMEHIWFRQFSLPSLLYISTRYGVLIYQGFNIAIIFISPGRSCTIIADVLNIITFFPSTGVQGLLIIRAYSICEGNKILISALALGFCSYFGLYLYGIIAFAGCSISSSNKSMITFEITNNIIAVCTDLLIFGICMWKVWGTWRLKRNNGIQSNGGSLISVLLTQSILRCCFVITITIAHVPIKWLTNSSDVFLAAGFNLMQNALSTTLVADFTLDLRHLNSAKIEASRISLPPLQFSNVLQHVHQSFLVEMATPEERNVEDEAADYDHDNFPRSTDDIQFAED